MKIICIEEHVMDLDIAKAAQPAVQAMAPYTSHQRSGKASAQPRNPHRPTRTSFKDGIDHGTEFGAGRLAEMDAQGIRMQIMSYNNPVQLAPGDRAVPLARAANDRLAQAVAAHPDRFAGFAALPWQDPAAAADELSRAVNELGFKGALLIGRPGDTFLDDPRYLPVLQRLHDLGVPLYLHPFAPLPQVQAAYYAGFSPELTAEFSLAGWGWHNEAGIHVLRLLLSGIFEKLPGLQLISGHWGEMVPFFLARLDFAVPPTVTGLSRTITETYRSHVWLTPSGMFDLPHFKFIHEVIGADRIIWSADYPFLTMDGAREFLLNLPVSDAEKEMMAHGNAEKLFGL